MRALFRFDNTMARHPDVAAWFASHQGPLGVIALNWFEVLRQCGSDVREVLHDGQPTICVHDAAFAYVDAFKAHVNVGFFQGAELHDPAGLLVGSGKFMRHVKLSPGIDVDTSALEALIDAAYTDVKKRLQVGSHESSK